MAGAVVESREPGAESGALPRPPALRAKAGSLLQRQGAVVALVAVCIFGTMRYAPFATPENLLNVLRQNSMLGLVALGMTMVILTGGIDLSVGAVLAVWGIVAAMLADQGTGVALAGGRAFGGRLIVVAGVEDGAAVADMNSGNREWGIGNGNGSTIASMSVGATTNGRGTTDSPFPRPIPCFYTRLGRWK